MTARAEHRPYLAHLRGRDVDSVASDASSMRDLTASPGWRILIELVDGVHGEAVTRLLLSHAGSDGMVYEQAEYARLLGFLSGLRQFRWAAEAFIEHAERVHSQEG